MSELLNNDYQLAQDFLAETIGEYGPWKALQLFTDTSLTGLERMHIHDATCQSIWRTVEYENSRMIDDHLLVIGYMERAVTTEILANLERAAATHTEPLDIGHLPATTIDHSLKLV